MARYMNEAYMVEDTILSNTGPNQEAGLVAKEPLLGEIHVYTGTITQSPCAAISVWRSALAGVRVGMNRKGRSHPPESLNRDLPDLSPPTLTLQAFQYGLHGRIGNAKRLAELA